MNETAGNHISTFRKARGMSQQALAEAVGAHWITVSKLERGKLKLTYEWAQKIAAALEVGVWAIYPYIAKELDLTGTISNGGKVLDNTTGVQSVAMDRAYYSNEDDEWLIVGTEDFFPIIQEMDIVRLSPVSESQLGSCVGRLCLVTFEQDEPTRMLGILSQSNDGQLALLRVNGSLIKLGGFKVIACVTMAIFGLGELDVARRIAVHNQGPAS